MSELHSHYDVQVSREHTDTLKRRRDRAIARIIDVADHKGGPVDENSTNIYHYARQEFELIAASRGMQLDSPPSIQGLPAPEGTHTLVVEPDSLTIEELDDATAAVWEHDGLTPEMRRLARIPLGEDGIPIVADVEACLAFIDDQDPQIAFSLADSEQTDKECTHSCKCWQKVRIIKPEHRREVLSKNGEPYDPPGTSPRNKELREVWREEKGELRGILRRHGLEKEQAYRGVQMPDSVPVGDPQDVTWDVNPLFVQSERDGTRNEVGIPTVVDPKLRPHLEREYVLGATAAQIEAGYVPQSPEAILNPERRTPLQRIDGRRKGLQRFLPWKSRQDTKALEEEHYAVREQIARMIDEGQTETDSAELASDPYYAGMASDPRTHAEIVERWLHAKSLKPGEFTAIQQSGEQETPRSSNYTGMGILDLLDNEPTVGRSVPPGTMDAISPREEGAEADPINEISIGAEPAVGGSLRSIAADIAAEHEHSEEPQVGRSKGHAK